MTEHEPCRTNDSHHVTMPAKHGTWWVRPEQDDAIVVSNTRTIDPLLATMQPARLMHAVSAQASVGQGRLVQQSILRLQRTHGNRHVQRMLGLARRSEGEGEVTTEVEWGIERARGGRQYLESSVLRKMETGRIQRQVAPSGWMCMLLGALCAGTLVAPEFLLPEAACALLFETCPAGGA